MMTAPQLNKLYEAALREGFYRGRASEAEEQARQAKVLGRPNHAAAYARTATNMRHAENEAQRAAVQALDEAQRELDSVWHGEDFADMDMQQSTSK